MRTLLISNWVRNDSDRQRGQHCMIPIASGMIPIASGDSTRLVGK
ncbi:MULTISPECIES: hypothetical protein [unclassified Microcoleus]|nr:MULTISPECIES: hypothetical protein [unclassified Microcoleus]